MKRRREPKKSESLEVRLPHEVKSALMHKAHSEGRSASDVIRSSIDAYLADRRKETPNMLVAIWKPLAVAGAGAAAILWLGLAAAPVAAGPDLRAAFNTFDHNGDGSVTLEEFRKGHAEDRLFVRSGAGGHENPPPFMIPLHHDPKAFDNGMPVPTAMLQAEFAKEDSDKNGAVDFNEFKEFHVAMMNAAFGEVDRNRDGGIDTAEFVAVTARLPAGAPHASFADLDKNRDGKLQHSEFFGHHP